MGGTSAARRIPLRYCVPLPPRLFVGREDELQGLDALATRSGLSWVWGEAGFGKSALVHRWLSDRVMDDRGDPLWIALRPDRHEDTHELELGQLMASLRGVGWTDWRGARDPTALHETLFDLAEASSHVVVLDDAHHHVGRVEQLAQLVTAHATRSRWIVVARTPPVTPALVASAMQLAPLPDARLRDLARAAAPASLSLDAALRAARGSPLRLLSALGGSGARSGIPWDGLPQPLAAVAQLVAALPRPVPVGALVAVAGGATRDTLDALDARGAIEIRDGLVSLHESARAQLSADARDAAVKRWGPDLARELAASGDAGDQVEAARLLLRAGATDAAATILEDHLEPLVDAGFAGEIFAALPVVDARLRALRLRFALQAGTGEALAWARGEPVPDDPATRVAWATAAALAGDPGEARKAVRPLRDAGPAPWTFEASLVEALSCRLVGDLDAALALTGGARTDPTEEARRLVERAQALSTRGDVADARAASAAAEGLLDAIRPSSRVEVLAGLVAVHFRLGRLKDASRLVRRQRKDALLVPDQSGFELAIAAVFAIESGDLEAGEAFVARLRRGAGDTEILRVIAAIGDLRILLARGEGDAAEERIPPLLLDTRENDSLDELAAWAVGLASYGAIVLGLDDVDGAAAAASEPRDVDVTVATPVARTLARRRGRHAADTPPAVASSRKVELFRLRELAEERLLGGDRDGAKRHLARLAWLAEREGWVLHELDALLLRADVAILESSPREAIPRLARVVTSLRRRAGEPRWRDEARFLEAVAEPGGPSDEALRELRAASSPIVARRARTLLGELPPVVDRIDVLVLAALTARRRGAAAVAPPGAAAPAAVTGAATWTFDAATRRATMTDGRIVDLQRHAILVRLVEALLVSRELERSKEELASEVWSIRDYHPLRDDKRIHVAAHRLRLLIENDADRPERLITTADGYALRHLLR